MSQAGLHIIFDSARDADPPSRAEVDAVAVHGLNINNSSDHARETWAMGEKLWLKDFLPPSLPKPVRVMLFAYNANPAMGAAAIDLEDHAKVLLQWLRLKRRDAPQRPLVFICHSLGGLVVKEALLEAILDPTFASIVEATRLLVFFATPHQGGNYASFGDIVAKIVRAGLLKPGNNLLNALKEHSNQAINRFQRFRHLYDRYLVVSFFEGLPYGRLGIIVDKKSATLNLPGTRETQVAMEADHSSICKFDSADSPACELVLETISTELERGLTLFPDPIPSVVKMYVDPPESPFGERQYNDTVEKAVRASNALRETGRIEEALAVHQWLLDGQVHHKGHQHPDAAYTRFLMGNTYAAGARWREAAAQFKLALEAQSAVLGEQDCFTLRTQLALGKSYLFVGSLPEALGILERTLATQRHVLPDAHPDTVDTMINLAAAYGQEEGHSEASRDLLLEAVQALENTVPLNRHLLVPALVNLGKTCEDSGLFGEAKGHYLRALELEKTDSGASKARVQHIQNLLVELCEKTNMDLPA